jgi:hypothetical protein
MLGRTLKITAFIVCLALLASAQTIPSGTHITVRMGQEISSGTAKAGDRFDATLTRNLVVGGKMLAKTGVPARGKVTSAKSSGRLHAPGQLSVRLTSVQVGGKMVPISTGIYHIQGKSHTKSNATKIGGGAAVGALIGGLAGGGKGALIGAGAGGAAGTGLAAATGKQEAIIPSEKTLSFTTTAAAKVK